MVTSSTPHATAAPTITDITTEVRAEIARKSATVRDLADALGVAPATVSRKLAGLIPLTVAELLTVCHWLDVSPSTLLADAERRAQPKPKRRSA